MEPIIRVIPDPTEGSLRPTEIKVDASLIPEIPFADCLVPYLPRMAKDDLYKLQESQDLDDFRCPRSTSYTGIVMFLDVSGFTPLTERLSKLGPEGAEIINDTLCKYFTELLRIIDGHGGDVVKFAGDALLVIWPGETYENCCLAVKCAMTATHFEMLHLVDDYPHLQDFKISLTVKAAIGRGPFVGVHLGGVSTQRINPILHADHDHEQFSLGRKEYLLVGEALHQMAECMKEATASSVIVSKELWEQVRAFFIGDMLNSGNVRVTEQSQDLDFDNEHMQSSPAEKKYAFSDRCVELLKGYAPAATIAKLECGLRRSFLADLRSVTVVFIGLLNIDCFSSTCIDQFQLALQTILTTIFHYDGELRQCIVDDKGAVVIAAFGLSTKEDDPLRAVHSCLTIHQELKEVNIKTAIGITTGKVFCGEVGSVTRSEYTIVGDTVNLSARLMAAAYKMRLQKSILCDDTTYRACQERIMFTIPDPISVKGKEHKIKVYSPNKTKAFVKSPGAKTPTRGRRKIVGRTWERTVMINTLRDLQDRRRERDLTLQLELMDEDEEIQHKARHNNTKATTYDGGYVVIIQGMQGTGKSTLLNDFYENNYHGAFVIKGKCTEIASLTPYYAISQVVMKLAALDPELPAEQLRDSLSNLLMITSHSGVSLSMWERYLPLLNSVIPFEFSENSTTQHLEGIEKREKTEQLLIDLIVHLVEEHPKDILIVVEDYHWMDPSSEAVLVRLGDIIASLPMLLFISTRPLATPPDSLNNNLLDKLSTKPYTEVIELNEMEQEEIVALAAKCLGGEMAKSLQDEIVSKAQGNPFFADALCRSLQETGGVSRGPDGKWILKNDNINSIPDTIERIITTRIDCLIVAQQTILRVASVIGTNFPVDILSEVMPVKMEADVLLDELFVLEELRLVVKISEQPLQYQFYHVIAQQVAYNSISFGSRQKWHRATGRGYEKRLGVGEDMANVRSNVLSVFPLLGYHWKVGNRPKKAVAYYERAAAEAFKAYANKEAMQLYGEAIKLAQHVDIPVTRKSAWRRRLAELAVAMGEKPQGVHHLKESLVYFGKEIPGVDWIASHLNEVQYNMLTNFFSLVDKPEGSGGMEPQEVLELSLCYTRLIFLLNSVGIENDTFGKSLALVQFYVMGQLLELATVIGMKLFCTMPNSPHRLFVSMMSGLPEAMFSSLWRTRVPNAFQEHYQKFVGAVDPMQYHLAEYFSSSSNLLRKPVNSAMSTKPRIVPQPGAKKSFASRAAIRSGSYRSSSLDWDVLCRPLLQAMEGMKGSQSLPSDTIITYEDYQAILINLHLARGYFHEGLAVVNEYLNSNLAKSYVSYQEVGLRLKFFLLAKVGKSRDAMEICQHIESKVLMKQSDLDVAYHFIIKAYLILHQSDTYQNRAAALELLENAFKKLPPHLAWGNFILYLSTLAELSIQLLERNPVEGKSKLPEARLTKLITNATDRLWLASTYFPVGTPYAWLHQGTILWVHATRTPEHSAPLKEKAVRAWKYKALVEAEIYSIPYLRASIYMQLGRHVEDRGEKMHYLRSALNIFERSQSDQDIVTCKALMLTLMGK